MSSLVAKIFYSLICRIAGRTLRIFDSFEGLPAGDAGDIGPFSERDEHPLQRANAGAYTRKDMSGVWTYFPGHS